MGGTYGRVGGAQGCWIGTCECFGPVGSEEVRATCVVIWTGGGGLPPGGESWIRGG